VSNHDTVKRYQPYTNYYMWDIARAERVLMMDVEFVLATDHETLETRCAELEGLLRKAAACLKAAHMEKRLRCDIDAALEDTHE